MASPIQAVRFPEAVAAAAPAARAEGAPGEFQNLLAEAAGKVETLRAGARQSVERFLAGESEELHQAVLATQRAELSFELFLQTRNKVVQAYQEVMRMQL